MYQAAVNELIASAQATLVGHEINPDFMIGCMIAMCPVYPATDKPEDIMMHVGAMHKRYWFAEVHARGFLPEHIVAYWQRKGIKIDISEEEKEILKKERSTISHSLITCPLPQRCRVKILDLTTMKAAIWFAMKMYRPLNGAGRLTRWGFATL